MNDKIDSVVALIRQYGYAQQMATSFSCEGEDAKSDYHTSNANSILAEIRAALEQLAQPKGEAVGVVAIYDSPGFDVEWTNGIPPHGTKLYTTPPAIVPQSEHDALRSRLEQVLRDYNIKIDELTALFAEHDKALARVRELEAFVCKVAEQIPEKPDYWSSCGQCEHNIDDAKELSTHPADEVK